MKKIIIAVLAIGLLASGAYIYLSKNGYNSESILNMPNKFGLNVECTDIDNLLLTATIDLTVINNSSKTHENVVVHLTAYDKNGNILKQKDVKVKGKLKTNEELYKTATIPAKTEKCDCVIQSSDSY